MYSLQGLFQELPYGANALTAKSFMGVQVNSSAGVYRLDATGNLCCKAIYCMAVRFQTFHTRATSLLISACLPCLREHLGQGK